MSLRDFICSNFTITGLESSFVPKQNRKATSMDNDDDDDDDNTTNPELNINIENVSAICHGSYHSSGLSGQVQAVVGAATAAESHALEFAATVVGARQNHSFVQPHQVRVTECQTQLAVTDLRFFGSLSAHTIQLFAKQIRSSVTKALSTQICPLVSSTLEPALDEYLDQINQWLEPYLSDDDDDDDDKVEFEYEKVAINDKDTSNHHAPESFSDTKSSNNPGRLNKDSGIDQSSFWQTDRALLERHHTHKKETLKWSHDAPALVGFLQILNKGLEYFLQQGLLQRWLPIYDDDKRPHSCGFFFDGINSLIRSVLYDSNGWVELPLLTRWENLHFVIPKYAAIRLKIQNVSVHGLDHWEALQLFAPDSDDESFVTRLSSYNVTFRTHVHLVLSAVPDGVIKGDELKENFVIDLNATSLDTIINFHLDLDKQIFQERISVGTVWEVLEGVIEHNSTRPQLPCLLESIEKFSVGNLSALWHVQSLSFQPELKGNDTDYSLEEALDLLLNNALQMVWTEFPEMVTQSVKGLARGPVLDALNAFFERITTTNETCVSSHQHYQPHWIDFNNVGWLSGMNEFFARSSTKRHIDSYLQCGANYLSSAVQERLPNSVVRFRKLAFEQLGHLRDFELLAPLADGHSLRSGFLFGSDDASTFPSLDINVGTELPDISAEFNLTVKWNDIGAASTLALNYDLGRLKQYPLSQILKHGHCLLVPTDELNLHSVSNRLETFSVSLNSKIEYGAQQPVSINWTSLGAPNVEMVASAVWGWAVNSSRDVASLGTMAIMGQANNMCQGKKQSYDDEGTNEDYLSISLVVCAIVLLAQPAVLMIHGEGNEEENFRRRVEEQEQYEDALLRPQEYQADSMTDRPGSSERQSKSLMEQFRISDIARIAIPVAIGCTIVILLCSNLSVGADVKLEASIGGQLFVVPSLFSFSLYNTAKEMLAAKIYSLLLLVAVFSGLWPYLKLFLMLFGWLRPFSRRNVKIRNRLFLALDALGKFSLVDTYVLVLMVVAFRYHLELEGGINVDVFVVPQFGFYGFLVGTVSSLVLSHALVFYHRRAEINISLATENSEVKPLISHSYKTGNGEKALSNKAKAAITAHFVCTCGLLLIGMTRESFIFEFGGIAGDLKLSGKDAAYSLLSLGNALPESVEKSSGFGVASLQAAYFFFAVAAPFCCLFFLLVLFVYPLDLKQQFMLLTCAEIANAWSAVEVFCLSIVAAVLEISTFASFIVGDKCDFIDSILQKDFDEAADTCYSVSAFVSWDATFLVFGVVMNSALVSVMLRFAHTAIDEKVDEVLNQSRNVDRLAARDVSFVERFAGWKGMSWILSLPPGITNENNEPLLGDMHGTTALSRLRDDDDDHDSIDEQVEEE